MSFSDWLLADIRLPKGIRSKPETKYDWWRVMCLTGVDYFSTLGYQPGIAFLAAGLLSPLATLVLVAVTLFGALPVYRRVAEASPHGQGSISMLEKLFPKWGGKTVVLVLLGFATTDFVITMTLSAADGAAHFINNPFTPVWMRHQMGVTLVILAILGGIFLRGFKEAIGIAVLLVVLYLTLNGIITVVGLWQIAQHPEAISTWSQALWARHGNPFTMLAVCLILFPKLALGLSGFETGVAVMPLVKCEGDTPTRIRNTRKLLRTAALIMSVFLFLTSIVTTFLIPPDKFQTGGDANGRALAYLSHRYLGNGFGTLYDISTILILGFAGASAMAGLLNLIPRYLPRFGMAPEWARASRPLVLVFLFMAVVVTVLFDANVDAQGGAYATGVLVLITSAAFAVTVTLWRDWRRWPFALITLVFVYTTILNIVERPEGIKIATFFTGLIVVVSLVSRAIRSTELRINGVYFDDMAKTLLAEDEDQIIRLVARKPRSQKGWNLDVTDRAVRIAHNLDDKERLYFFEVERSDASDFEEFLHVTGERVGNHSLLHARSPVVANSIAAVLICLRDTTGRLPHAYFEWNEGNPVWNLFRFVFLGEGDAAPLTHEVLRRTIEEPAQRPIIHVS